VHGPWETFDRTGSVNRFEAHGLALMELLGVLIDAVCLVVATIACSLVYRFPTLRREFWSKTNACDRRVVCWEHLGGFLLDLPFVVLLAPIVCFGGVSSLGFRSYCFLRDVYRLNTASERR